MAWQSKARSISGLWWRGQVHRRSACQSLSSSLWASELIHSFQLLSAFAMYACEPSSVFDLSWTSCWWCLPHTIQSRLHSLMTSPSYRALTALTSSSSSQLLRSQHTSSPHSFHLPSLMTALSSNDSSKPSPGCSGSSMLTSSSSVSCYRTTGSVTLILSLTLSNKSSYHHFSWVSRH